MVRRKPFCTSVSGLAPLFVGFERFEASAGIERLENIRTVSPLYPESSVAFSASS